MNRYQGNHFLTSAEKHDVVNFNRLYTQARELILRSDDYNFNQVVELLAEQENINQREVKLFILERFNREEGALPGDLEQTYLDIRYDPKIWSEKIATGQDFYNLIKEVNNDFKNKGIILNNDLIKEKIDYLKQVLGVN